GQIRSLRSAQTVLLVEVLHVRTTRATLQLSACFGEEEEIRQHPTRVERGRRRRRDAATGRARDKSNKFESPKVCGVTQLRREFRQHFGVEVEIVSDFADSSPRCGNTEDDVVSKVRGHAAIPDA